MSVVVFLGPCVHSLSKDHITVENKVAIAVKKEDGKILIVDKSGDLAKVKSVLGEKYKISVNELKEGQFLCPGFIDVHIHAPQFPNIGLGYDMPLLEWLQKYTIPLEMQYKHENFAQNVYERVVDTTLNCGTTFACYYGTIYKNTTLQLAEIVANKGQRAIIGKVNMNQNSFGDYIEDTEESVRDTEEFIKGVQKLNSLVEPAVTPRFAISCDMKLLTKLGDLAKRYNSYIQTHVSENQNEVEFAKELFPECKSYSEIYEKSNLLTKKTILGHGVYLGDDECKLLHSKGVTIAHCANSNTVLRSGLCNVRRLFNHNVKVGLGTDVSGGSDCSILNAMQSTLTTSMHVSFSDSSYQPLTFEEVFYLATLGGAEALGKDDILGNFIEGKEFDALVVDMRIKDSKIGSMDKHSLIEWVQKFIYCGDDRNIRQVYIKGKLIKSK